MGSLQQYLDLYTAQADIICRAACPQLNEHREKAFHLLQKHGLPHVKDERYKYTDAEEAFAPDYGLNLKRTLPLSNPYITYRCAIPNLSTSLYFVINDVPYPHSPSVPLPQGVRVESLRQAAATSPELLTAYYNRAAAETYDGVTALNTLLAQDGLLVHIPAGVTLKNPIQIVNVAASTADLMINRRVIIIAEKGASAAILFCDHADGHRNILTTQVVEAYAHPESQLQLYTIEETCASHTLFNQVYVEQRAESRVSYNGVTLTNGNTRNRMDFHLKGEGASMVARGVVVADGNERVDNSLLIDHAAAHCTSELLYKYVLDGHSVGAFAGKVLVRQGAQKSLSEQTNANLCASPYARAYSQPMLEIYADDVKCNHGSTIGKLDETALFYMRQRGIQEHEARLLLQHAFVNDVIRHIELERLRDRLAHLVENRFRGELSACQDCKMKNSMAAGDSSAACTSN